MNLNDLMCIIEDPYSCYFVQEGRAHYINGIISGEENANGTGLRGEAI